MATAQLKLVFETMAGEKTWTFKNANPSATVSDVKNLMDTMITNGSIYKYPPLTKVSATAVVTTTTEYDLSDD